jgi:acyl carrier protein
MNANIERHDRVESAILSALGEKVSVGSLALGNDDDVFGALGLDSMQTFGVLVSLEKKLGITIGQDDESEFDRVRTLGGLRALLKDKLRAQ